MKRSQLLDYLADQIIEIRRPHPVRVALDGPDAAGKTTLAQNSSARCKDVAAGYSRFH